VLAEGNGGGGGGGGEAAVVSEIMDTPANKNKPEHRASAKAGQLLKPPSVVPSRPREDRQAVKGSFR